MAAITLSGEKLLRVFVPAPGQDQKTSRLQTVLTSLGDLAAWIMASRLPAPIATSVAFSGVLAVGKQVKTVTGLSDVKAGDRLIATPGAALPGNLMLGAVRAPADGQVAIEFGVLAAVTLNTVTVPIALTVLR